MVVYFFIFVVIGDDATLIIPLTEVLTVAQNLNKMTNASPSPSPCPSPGDPDDMEVKDVAPAEPVVAVEPVAEVGPVASAVPAKAPPAHIGPPPVSTPAAAVPPPQPVAPKARPVAAAEAPPPPPVAPAEAAAPPVAAAAAAPVAPKAAAEAPPPPPVAPAEAAAPPVAAAEPPAAPPGLTSQSTRTYQPGARGVFDASVIRDPVMQLSSRKERLPFYSFGLRNVKYQTYFINLLTVSLDLFKIYCPCLFFPTAKARDPQ